MACAKTSNYGASVEQQKDHLVRINVMFLCDEWKSSKGGLSTFNREFAVNLAKTASDSIKVHCYVSQSDELSREDAKQHGVNLITAQAIPGSTDPLDWLKIPPPELPNPDIVIGHGRKFGTPAYFIVRTAKCKWVHFVHVFCEDLGKFKVTQSASLDTIEENEKKHRSEIELCKAADLVVAVGSRLQQKYCRSLPNVKVEIITPGILEKFSNESSQLVKDRSVVQNFKIFMFGRANFEDLTLKGYDIVANAIGSLDKMFELTFVGSSPGEHRKIEQWFLENTRISRNQMTIRSYCNDQDELKMMFHESDLVALPSRTEGFGLVALEAISADIPVLVAGESGIAKALQEVESGKSVIVESDDAEEWAQRIQQLSNQSPEERHDGAKLLRENYNKTFSWSYECDRFKRIIQDLVKSVNGLKIKVDVETMKAAEHNTQDKTPDSATQSGRSPDGRHQEISAVPVSSAFTQSEVQQAGNLIPTEGEILRLIAKNYLLTTPPRCKDDHTNFLLYMQQMRHTITDVNVGSLVITVRCDLLEVLEGLWVDYTSGRLGKVVQRCFVTEEILTELNLAELKLKTTILEEEYKAYKMYFEKGSARGCQSMALALPSFASTKETTNYGRLCRLLVDLGSQALRDTFDSIHPPAGLHHVLARPPEHATLQSLHTGRRRVINPTQWGKLYPIIPSSVSSASFDITLLMILLRNICGLHPPATGWDSLPPAADTSKEANIARLKYYRNSVYGHASQASVDDVTFNTYWQDISAALVALGGTSYGAAINKLKTECMDPDMEEHYRELLRQWKKHEDSMKVKLVEIEGNVKDKLGEVEDKIRNDIEQLNEKLDTLMVRKEGSSSKDKDETRDDLKQMKSEIQNISEKLNSQMSQREETMDQENTHLQQVKGEIRNVKEKLDSLMNQPPPVKEKPRIEDAFDPAELIHGIRQLYKLREGWLAPFPWCEEFHFHLENIYTRLQVISRKKERGRATANTVDMSGIFKPHDKCSQPRTVLIEGKPGMGKTTYCKKLVYDWATGNQEAGDGFPRFETALLLRCRDMRSNLWEAIDDQLLPREVKEDVRERFFDFIRDNQSNVLLILDGLDEVPANKLPMFSEILQGKVLPECRLFATARHEAGIKVRIHCDTLLEIEGFTEKDARNFIFKYFKSRKDLTKKFVRELRHDSNLKTLARNPLNTALLCLFCEDRQGKFPKNKSQLYQEVVQCILRRYRKKEGLPETQDDLLEVYRSELKHLGWIAFEGLCKDSLDFEESKLTNHSEDIPRFGVLSVQLGGSKLRPCHRYSFPHKSFQWWFAAFYLCFQLVEGKSSPDRLLNKLDSGELGDDDSDEDDGYSSRKENFLDVLCFAINMLAARCEELAVALIKSMAALEQVSFSDDLDDSSWGFLAISCIKEFKTDNRRMFIKLAHAFGSALKCESVGFKDPNKKSTDCTDDIAVLAEALKVNTTVDSMFVMRVVNDLDGASCLANALKQNSTLTKLNLQNCFTGGDGAADLADALKVNTTLTELILSRNSIGVESAARFAEVLRVSKTLTRLDLSLNGIGSSGAACLADALKVNRTLTELILPYNNIGVEGAVGFAEALRVNKTLTKLDLHHSFTGGDGAAHLADALKVNTTLTELILSQSSIGVEGAARFTEALKVNKALTKLDLRENVIGNSGAACLADALKSNTGLSELNLFGNGIGDQGAARFAEALRVNKTLTKLKFTLNDIGNSGAACLADALKSNTGLIELNLNGNLIDMDGIASLVDALQLNTTLAKLNLFGRTLYNSNPATIDDPRDKAVVTELVRLVSVGRVIFF